MRPSTAARSSPVTKSVLLRSTIGETKLLLHLWGAIDLAEQVLGVCHSHNGIELGLAADIFIDKESLRDGRWIGQPGRFDDDAIHAAALAPHQTVKNPDQIAA